MGKVIAFANNKGGCGKTTSVCAIGQAWASYGKKILFVDLDSQSNLTSIITNTDQSTKEWDNTIEDAFVGGPEFGLPIVNVRENIDIVPSDLDLSNFDTETMKSTGREYLLADLLATVKNNYDYILIDCPPALGMITYNALIASDYLVIVTNADGLSYKGVKMIAQLYQSVASNPRMNPDLQLLGFLVTRLEKSKLSELYLNRIRKDVGALLIEPYIRKSTKVQQAASFNQDIYKLDPTGKATKDYLAVAQELIARIEIN